MQNKQALRNHTQRTRARSESMFFTSVTSIFPTPKRSGLAVGLFNQAGGRHLYLVVYLKTA